MGFDRRLIQHFDWMLFFLTAGLVSIGVLGIYSATYEGAEYSGPWVTRQVVWVLVGLVGMALAFAIDYRHFEQWAYVFYVVALCLLILVPLVGSFGGGARRWIHLGPFSLQPAEFMKIGLLLVIARFFNRYVPAEGYGIRDILIPAVFVALPAVLILLQPNLGTTVTLGLLFLTLAFVAGLRLRSIAVLSLLGSAILPFVWARLQPYQRQRMTSFLHPDVDPLGAGYHMIQAKVTVGSGMLWGKGFLLGTQNRLDFLPEKHTDFIFAVLAEEWGFVGTIGLLLLYGALLARLIVIALRARERFGLLIAVGAAGMVFWQIIINIGMNVGVLPVVGVPLPLLSYGGSSLLTMMVALGLALNVSTRRFLF